MTTADLHECNGVVEGPGVESGEVEVGEIRKVGLVEENLKSSEKVDDEDNLAEGVQCELKLENGEVKSSDHGGHGAEEIESQRSENGHDLKSLKREKKNGDDDVVENGATAIDAQSLVGAHNSAHGHEKDSELQCLTNEDIGVETKSAKNEEQESVPQVVGDAEEEVESKSAKNEEQNSVSEVVGDGEEESESKYAKIEEQESVSHVVGDAEEEFESKSAKNEENESVSQVVGDAEVESKSAKNEEQESVSQIVGDSEEEVESKSAKNEEQESVSQIVGDAEEVESNSANNEEQESVSQVVGDAEEEVESKSAKNEEQESFSQVVGDVEEIEPKSANDFEEVIEDNNIGLSDQDEGKKYVQEDGVNQSDSEEQKFELSEALPVLLERNCGGVEMMTQTLIDEESQHDSELMNEKYKSLENQDNAADYVRDEVHDWKPQFVLNEDKSPELNVEDRSIEFGSHFVVIEENKSGLQCMPNGSIELASHLDAADDKELESHIETRDDKGLESHMETHDDKVEEVSNGKDEASELEIGSFNEIIIDGTSDKSGETSGLSNGIEPSVLLENIADRDDWVSTGDPTLPNRSVPQISSNEPKLELDVPKKTFYCLVKIPRPIDNKIKAQIRLAELQVNEKHDRREFIRTALTMKRSSKNQILDSLKAARQKEKAIRDAIKANRNEMEPLQLTLNKMKNANSAEEYEEKIYHMEYRISHESMPLSEEKQLIREIKQLKASRNDLCASAGPHSELQEAFNHIDQIQDRSKLLGQELESLRKQSVQAEKDINVIEKEYNASKAALRQLEIQVDEASAVRQEAYLAFRDLKNQERGRNNEFYKNKDEIKEAKEYALAGDREALEKLCSNQVERIIEIWNKNAEFRKEYIKDNERSILRRLETFDGRSLAPDEEPPLPTNYDDEDPGTSLLIQGKHLPHGIRSVRDNKLTTTVERSNEESKPKGLQSPSKEVTVLAKKSVGQQSLSKEVIDPSKKSVGKSNNSGLVTKIESFEVNSEIVKNEEEDLAKKEEAVKMKEANRLEEKKKAKEAEERKRKRADKANARALARAQKEAERKEKERQKKANKKATAAASTATASDTTENGSALSGMQNDASRDSKQASILQGGELGSRNQKSTSSQRKKQISQKVKSVFPAVKKGKKGGQTWMWILLAVVLCLFLLVLWFLF